MIRRNLIAISAFAGGIGAVAHADVIGPAMTLTAMTGDGRTATIALEGSWDGDNYVWGIDNSVALRDDQGALARLDPSSGEYQDSTEARSGEHIISLNFAVTAGPADTMFIFSSALLSFPTVSNPDASASAAFTLTDTIGDGAALTGMNVDDSSYLAQYNGFVPTGTTFGSFIPDAAVASPFGTTNANDGRFDTILEDVSDMSVRIAFELSAFDQASGTTIFVVIPEPTTALLALAGAALLIRRR